MTPHKNVLTKITRIVFILFLRALKVKEIARKNKLFSDRNSSVPSNELYKSKIITGRQCPTGLTAVDFIRRSDFCA